MKFYYPLFFFFISIFATAQNNQLWKGYYSYQETTAVEKDDQNIYIATENAVFAYNEYTKETEIFNTINGLKIDEINTLGYSADYKKLIVGSKNGKVAIIDMAADKIYHLNDIFAKTNIPDNQKIINKIIVQGGYAYLATGYGITAVRLNDNHFGDTYYVAVGGEMSNVKSIAVFNNYIYATVGEEGIKKASINTNLIDYNNWQVVDFGSWLDLTTFANKLIGVKEDLSLNTISATNQIDKVDDVWGGFLKLNVAGDVLIEVTHEAARLRATDLSVYNEFIYSLAENGGVNDAAFSNGNYFVASKTNGALKVALENKENTEVISPSGPLSNNVSSATINNNNLWLTFGGYGVGMNPYEPNGLTKYGISSYKGMQTWQHVSFKDLREFKSTVNISFNPQKPNVGYISSFHDGLAVWDMNSNELNIYNADNTGVLKEIGEDDTRIYGVAFDSNGTGWMTNTIAQPTLITIDKNNQFNSYTSNVFLENSGSSYLMPVIDKNGTKWFGSSQSGVLAFNETRNNKAMQITTSHNLPSPVVRSIALDYKNELWIGTLKGLRVIKNVDQFLNNTQLTPANIVIMDDGKAQELFYEQDVMNITVDGSNNKWVSIAESGVFLISDKNETIYNFTAENSPLPSNDVIAVTINGATGEVFFITRKGIVSFKNYATTPANDLNDIKVYPNPVRPDFTGEVKISGLVSEATVKITDISGNLVYETKSLGGTVTWGTQSFSGAKVPSGVYMIFISSQDGTLDAVKKGNDCSLMQVKTQAIVLSALRYQEKSLIVKCFTQHFGLKTYFVRNAFSVKNKQLNSAYFQPLNQLQIDATHKNKGALEYINDLKLLYPYQTISVAFYKNAVSIFLAEILSHTIKEEQPNDKLFIFLTTTLKWFDEHPFSSDFHLWFLVQYTKFLGFYPDDSDKNLRYFNPNEGSFNMHFTPNCFSEVDTVVFKKLFELSLKEQSIKFTNKERKQALKQLLYYYEMHLTGFKPLKSVDVLADLF